jgi:very-short-patch-repair endonuclease
MKHLRIENFYYRACPELIDFARELRLKMTPAEQKMWSLLRRKQLSGYRFRRQHPISHYIADFLCFQATLIIELDGEIHLNPEQKVHDEIRSAYLESLEFRVIRFKNQEVLETPELVISKIESILCSSERK